MEKVQPIRDKKALEAMKRILRRKSYRDYIMFLIGCNTALRVGDLLRLTVGDAQNEHIVIREEKTGKTRRFKLPERVRKELAEYTAGMGSDSPLFPSRKGGKAISSVQAWRIIKEAARAANLEEIGTHSLRKTFSYHAYHLTKDIAIVQHVLNHSSPSVTRRYLGIDDDEVEQALEGFEL